VVGEMDVIRLLTVTLTLRRRILIVYAVSDLASTHVSPTQTPHARCVRVPRPSPNPIKQRETDDLDGNPPSTPTPGSLPRPNPKAARNPHTQRHRPKRARVARLSVAQHLRLLLP